MDGIADHYKQNKADAEKTNIVCLLSYMESRFF
jgi:hypothetical protein